MIGERISIRLQALGISQAELARRVGLHQSTINGLIKGGQASSTRVHDIALALETTPAYLLSQTDDVGVSGIASTLNSRERRLLDMFHSIDAADQKAILQLLQTMSIAVRNSAERQARAS